MNISLIFVVFKKNDDFLYNFFIIYQHFYLIFNVINIVNK